MFKKRTSFFVAVFCLLIVAVPRAVAQPTAAPAKTAVPQACSDGTDTQASGALYQICMPDGVWNGELVIYAHGYTSPEEALAIPSEASLIAVVLNLQGYAFATTSYSTNGLAIRQGLADVVDLVDIFTAEEGEPSQVYLIGFSEGGIITTLGIENHADVFDGGLSMCGPTGDFEEQTQHFADFRLIFDYFFPSLMPGSPIEIPQSLIDDWDNYYAANVEPVITDTANEVALAQLFAVTEAAYDANDLSTRIDTTENLLWYSVFATNDAIVKLGGQPYDNQDRQYSGSDDDGLLNKTVPRFTADITATNEINTYYQTTGQLTVPLVTMHTTGDEIVPYWHATRYSGRTRLSANPALHEHIEVVRYGHCSFEQSEVLAAFDQLVALVADPPPEIPLSRAFLPLVQ